MADMFHPTIPLPFQNVEGRRSFEKGSININGNASAETPDQTTISFRLPNGEEGEYIISDFNKSKSPWRDITINLPDAAISWDKRPDRQLETLIIEDIASESTYILEKEKGVITYKLGTITEDGTTATFHDKIITRDEFIHAASGLVGPHDQNWTLQLSKVLPPATAQSERVAQLSQKTHQLNISTNGSCTIIREPLGDKPLTYCDKQPIQKKDYNPHTRFRPDAFYQSTDEIGRKTIAANLKNDPALQKTLPADVLEQLAQNIKGGITVLVEHQPAAPVRTAKTTPSGGKQH